MAANSKSSVIATLGKRVVTQIWTARSPHSTPASFTISCRRGVHATVYDKNQDDLVQPNIVPDEVIIEPQSEKYWAPHPKTGVFGPAADNSHKSGLLSAARNGEESVLEEKAWFRPTSLEDLEKPV